MFVTKLQNESVSLIEPNVDRDAKLSLSWLAGEAGRQTLKSMGIAPDKIEPTTIEAERQRIQDFLDKEGELNWMIETGGQVVGSIWVDMQEREDLAAPSIHVMIGDPSVRGHGIGYKACSSVIEWLFANTTNEKI